MARLFTDGAESGDMTRWSTYSASASTTIKRTGSYSYRFDTSQYTEKILASTYTELYFRFTYYAVTVSTVGTILEWRSGANVAGSFRIVGYGNSAASISMYDGTTLRATSSLFTMNAAEQHVFELYVKIAASPNGAFTVKFDGTTVLTWTGATDNQASIDRFRFSGPLQVFYIDDIAVNDTSGGSDNSWIGDGGVLAALVPTGAGNYTDLIASTGNAWDCVNEIPVSTTSTWGDYVYESTADKKSTYVMSDLAGLPAGASIARVWIELMAGESVAASGKIATLLRSATTDSQGSDQNLTIALARYLSAEYLTDPADSALWNSTKVNALEAGAVVR